MTCQHPACSFHVFASCTNHCMKNVCLKHLMEHGDIFIHDYTSLLNHLDESTNTLMKEVNFAMAQIIQRRENEIEQINRKYNEEQQNIRKQLAFAEAANQFYKDKHEQLVHSKETNECLIAQHDLEQLKSYVNQIKKSFSEPQRQPEVSSTKPIAVSAKAYACPLAQENVFGIKHSHNIRCDCDGPLLNKWNLLKHLEYYHRMLPEYALRLRDAVCDGQSPNQTKLFSSNEILYNDEYFIDCPLTNPKSIFGACTHVHKAMHIPCTKKQMAFPSMISHFTLYHRIKDNVAKKIVHAMKTKTLQSDTILFEKDQIVTTAFRKT